MQSLSLPTLLLVKLGKERNDNKLSEAYMIMNFNCNFYRLKFCLMIVLLYRVGPIKPICSKIQPKTWYILFLNTPTDLEDVYAFAFHPIAATLENVEYYEKIMKGDLLTCIALLLLKSKAGVFH